MIKAIVFDCFGVLYQGSLDYLYEITPVDKRQELLDLSHSSDFGYVSHDEYIIQVAALTGKSESELEDLINTKHVRHVEIFDFIRALKPNYKIGLLSNVGEHVIDGLISVNEQRELFDAAVFSSDVGMVKPFPEMYQLMCTRLGLLPEECIMIDDTIANVDGAVRVGMAAIAYHTKDQMVTELTQLLETAGETHA